MNAYLESICSTEQYLIEQLRQEGFEALCESNIDLFQKHIRPSFSYPQFSNRTERAKNPLQLQDDLISYISLYGLAHYQRFEALMCEGIESGLPIPNDHLKLIDYGCGQGIATLAVLEKLHVVGQVPATIDIVLIEPSSLSLHRASEWIQARAKALNMMVNITTYAHFFDCIKTLEANEVQHTCWHLYSNVLDMYHDHRFNMQHLLNLGRGHAQHNYHFAISPDFYSGSLGFQKFLQLQKPDHILVQALKGVQVDEYNCKYNTMCKRNSSVIACITYVKEATA